MKTTRLNADPDGAVRGPRVQGRRRRPRRDDLRARVPRAPARGASVFNATTGRNERVSRVYEVHADKHIDKDELVAGDIAAVVGLKDTLTGHTLADRGASGAPGGDRACPSP